MADPRLNIPSQKTEAKEWMQWHKDLLSVMPVDDANMVWKSYWDDRASSYKDDFALRQYMKGYGIDISSGIFDKLSDVGHGVTGTLSSIFKVGGTVVLVVGGVILISVLGIIIQVARKPLEAANTAAKFTPSGMSKH